MMCCGNEHKGDIEEGVHLENPEGSLLQVNNG